MPRGSDISVGIPVIGYFKSLTDALIGFWFGFNFLLVMVLAFMTAGSWFHILIRPFLIYSHFLKRQWKWNADFLSQKEKKTGKKREAQCPQQSRKRQIRWMAAWLADGQMKEEWATQRHWQKKLTNKKSSNEIRTENLGGHLLANAQFPSLRLL